MGFEHDEKAGVYMGFRRLSILDLSPAGHQPMVSAGGRYVVTFNGEIYNYQDLRVDLLARGHKFRGHSDTEVMLAAFEQWGCVDTVSRLRGMFAFALWDRKERYLWLARDRMGIKPLYVCALNGVLAYGSEARVFHYVKDLGLRGNRRAARAFLARLYVSGRESILEGVERLAPGEIVRYRVSRKGAVENERIRYWDIRDVATAAKKHPITDPAEAVEGLAQLLRESIRLRLVADVPVGALLSGGVDSSVVVGIMQELSPTPIRTFTVRFDDRHFDEGDVAQRVARVLGTEHTSVELRTTDALQIVPELALMSDEPMANPSFLPTVLVCRVARGSVVVALSGDGGDELFGGYNRYVHGARMIRWTRRIPSNLRRPVAKTLAFLGRQTVGQHLVRFLQPRSMGRQQSVEERLVKLSRMVAAADTRAAYFGLVDVGTPPDALWTDDRGEGPGILDHMPMQTLEEAMMLEDQRHYLPDDLLTKVDRASMWESLEARVPILDQEIVRFSWRLPLALKIRGRVSKWVLRQVAMRYVPNGEFDRPKMGFTVPVNRWLETELHEWARDCLCVEAVRRIGLLDTAAVAAMWRDFSSGRQEVALPLWAAAILHSWSDHWNVSF